MKKNKRKTITRTWKQSLHRKKADHNESIWKEKKNVKWNESKMKSLSLSTFGEKGVWLKDKIERQDDAAVNAASLSLAFSF
jgi:acyl-CoA thioesterase